MASVKSFLVQWSDVALVDLDGLLTHISRRNPQRAVEVWQRIKNRAGTLEQWPYRSRLVPELKALGLEDYREVIVYSYRILLRVRGNKVLILGLFDGRRNMEDILVERILTNPELL